MIQNCSKKSFHPTCLSESLTLNNSFCASRSCCLVTAESWCKALNRFWNFRSIVFISFSVWARSRRRASLTYVKKIRFVHICFKQMSDCLNLSRLNTRYDIIPKMENIFAILMEKLQLVFVTQGKPYVSDDWITSEYDTISNFFQI